MGKGFVPGLGNRVGGAFFIMVSPLGPVGLGMETKRGVRVLHAGSFQERRGPAGWVASLVSGKKQRHLSRFEEPTHALGTKSLLHQSKRLSKDRSRSSRDLVARLICFALLPLDLAEPESLRRVGPAGIPPVTNLQPRRPSKHAGTPRMDHFERFIRRGGWPGYDVNETRHATPGFQTRFPGMPRVADARRQGLSIQGGRARIGFIFRNPRPFQSSGPPHRQWSPPHSNSPHKAGS